MADNYFDMIKMEYPLKTSDKRKHPSMNLADRAKIFAPFAALKGHEEAIMAKQRIVVSRRILSEEAKELLDQRLHQIDQMLQEGKHPMVRVVYFQKDKEKSKEEEGGQYIQFTGMVARYSVTARTIQIVDKKLRLDDIFDIQGEELQ